MKNINLKHINYKMLLKNLLFILCGNLLYALGIAFFIIPSGLITGGTTGIGIFIHEITGFSLSLFILLFNILMFFIGFIFLGKKFALTTLISTLCYPLLFHFIEPFSSQFQLTEDLFLNTLFGGICIGASIALIIRVGASTGGMDIPPLLLHKYFRIPISGSLYVFDCIILAMQATFRDKDRILYGIVLVLIYSIVLDKLLMVGTNRMQLKIITDKPDEIKEKILHVLDRGVTLIHGQTGYLEKETEIVLSVVSNRELYKAEKLIHEIDANAFVMISRISEVHGRGFSSKKEYVTKY